MALLKLPTNPEGGRPTRLPILPAGDKIVGEDGRAWTVKDRKSVLQRLNAKGELLLDENHSLIRAAKQGLPSPRLAVLSKFQMDAEGAIWAENVEWTGYGANAYDQGHYAGLSPVLLHRKNTASINADTLGDVTSLHSVSLVNDPNLELPALNDKEVDPEMTPEQLQALLTAALAPITESIASIKSELETVKAENSKKVEAPAPEEDLAVSVNSACEKLISDSKLTPGEKDDFVAAATSKDALAALVRLYEKRPPAVSKEALELSQNSSQTSSKVPALGAQANKVISSLGWDKTKLFDGRPGL